MNEGFMNKYAKILKESSSLPNSVNTKKYQANVVNEKNLTRSERHNRTINSISDNKKKQDKKYAQFLLLNGYTQEQVDKLADDDKLTAEIASNFVKKGEQPSVLLGKILNGSITESKKLTEGTSNFHTMSNLPLLVFGDYDDVVDFVYEQTVAQLDNPDADIFDTPEFEENMDAIDYCVLTEDDENKLKKDVDNFNRTMKNERYDKEDEEQGNNEYDDVEVVIKSGYYEAYQLYCDTKYLADWQLERTKAFFQEMKKKYHLTEFGVAYRASNGETGYRKVTESIEDVKEFLQPLVTDDGKVRAMKNSEKLPRGVKFKSSNGTAGEISFKGTDYAFAIVDGKLKVMTSAHAGSNWSETIYKKESKNTLEDYDASNFEPRQRTAVDGITWWVVYDTKANKYSTNTSFGKYKTKKAAKYAIDSYAKKYGDSKDSSKSVTEAFGDTDETTKIASLAKYLNIDAEDITNTYGHEFETPDGDYLVLDEEEARDLAEESINSSIDEMGIEAFSEEFQNWVMNNAVDTKWFDEAMRESYESYVDDIKDETDSTYDNRLIQEMYDAGILTDDDFVSDDGGNIDYKQLSDDVDVDDKGSEYVEKMCENYTDSIEWYKSNFGESDFSDVLKEHPEILDRIAIIDECINLDGVAHFIATYDGDEIELDNSLYAYRTN